MSDLSKYNLPSGYHNEAVAICEEFFGNESKFEEWHVRRIESALHKWMCDGARVVESKLTRPNDAKWISVIAFPEFKMGEQVIFYDGHIVYTGRWDTEEQHKSPLGGYPTHVMPLPAPPKQSSEGEE